ncbi:unnamed protein product [Gongylonema pulchrum]|uniref:ASIC domain-containing protein n=1 Tax=Gongylonema pulchrum TaxID=637853 RepID=A0A183EB48_9BILA|nr:unnamed protein product [Gongylonema pulchrum]
MDSSESVNGHNYAKYIEPPELPLRYRTSLDGTRYSRSRRHRYRHRSGQTHGIIEKIRNFSENTTAHGVRRIFIARNAYTARLWLFGIILCFVILIVQAHHLVMKFNRYEKITSIELRFDYMQFPSVTFCNLNPYKKSLVRLVPSVKDTMDVYENAKSGRKHRIKTPGPFRANRRDQLDQKERLLELFSSEQEHDLSVKYWGNVKSRREIKAEPPDGTSGTETTEETGSNRSHKAASTSTADFTFSVSTLSSLTSISRRKRLVRYFYQRMVLLVRLKR